MPFFILVWVFGLSWFDFLLVFNIHITELDPRQDYKRRLLVLHPP